jgi:hypothetical protein
MTTHSHCRIGFVWLGVLAAILASSAKTGRVFSQTKTDASGATSVSPVLQQEHGQDARGTHQTQAAGTPRPEPPRISLQEFRIEPTSLSLGEPFVIHARAAATGIDLGSFLLRTADQVRKEDTIEGFSLYSNGKYYVAERGEVFLMDNGDRDKNPEENAIALRVSTEGWKSGKYVFAFFASCRPSTGPFVAARRDFAVVVENGRVVIEDLGDTATSVNPAIAALDVTPQETTAGRRITLSIATKSATFQGVWITNPFHIAPDDTLAGFSYSAERKKSYYGTNGAVLRDNGPHDRNPAPGEMALNIETNDWPVGVYHLQLDAIGVADRSMGHRNLAVKIRGPQDRLKVTVEDSYAFDSGTHFGKFVQLRDGTLLCGNRFSTDGGRTWQADTGGFGAGGAQLADGRVLGLEYRCLPDKEDQGWYRVERSVSQDSGRSFEKTQARVFVPEAKAAMGHGPHVGPLFMRSIVPRQDGSLVALMAGWFRGDDTPCPYGRGRPYSRAYTCESTDDGLTWRFLSNIAYEEIGSEGYNEGSLRRLPSGELLAVLRTGNEKDFHCQDNPIMWTVSQDDGQTWTRPERTGVEGAYPSLAVLSDGLVVMSYGRPGAMLVFSADGGRTWTDVNVVDTTPYSGYTDVVEVGAGHLLVGFGTKGYLDAKTGSRSDQLRLAHVRYEVVR